MRILIACLLSTILFQINGKAQAIVSTIKDSTTQKDYRVVQIESSFPGGQAAWIKYLQANLNADLGNKTIKIPKGEKSGRVSVMVSFIIDKMGYVSGVMVDNEKDVPSKLAKEAIRVIKDGPKWLPAQQAAVIDTPGLTPEEQVQATIKKGLQKVTSRKRQAITWQVDKD